MTDPSQKPATDFEALLALALERGASDLHLKAGRPPILRVEGEIVLTEAAPLDAAAVAALVEPLLDDRARAAVRERGAGQFSAALPGGDRFRVTVYRQRGRLSVAARRVSRHIPTFDALNLPRETLERICRARQGLVVFAGVTGTGKSTSIAACLEYINATRRCHVVTIEDPIEFLFEDKEAFIEQREIGADVPSYEAALESLLREDPDVVFVGEMRSRESVEGVLRAAETTRLVFTTTHATSAPGVIPRVLDLFEGPERRLLSETLAASLVAVVCQRLVPASDPNVGRVPATEVLLATPAVRSAIRSGETDPLPDLIAAGADEGMHDLTQDLARLVREEWVLPREAYAVAPNPDALKMAIRGIEVRKGSVR
jgi:twitching motility protein PilT